MQSELKSLSKIFSECIFRIPDYQRGYSWEQKHLKDFWNDIQQLPDGKNHYTGVLTLEPVASENYRRWEDDLWIINAKRYAPLYVVDGQQRLTTTIVLLQAILESIPDDATLNYTTKAEIRKKYIFESKDGGISRSYIFGYERDNPSYEYLKQSIFGEQSENHSISEVTIYTKNLSAAKVYFQEGLKGLPLNKIEEIYTKLTQHLHFNIFYIEPDLDVFVTFETMNNRGKPLSHLELLKNRLIYLSTRFEVEASERERLRKAVNESWKTVYHYLGKSPTRKLRDDTFLMTHFITYFGPTLPKKKSSDDGPDYLYDIRRYIRNEDYKDHLLDNVFTPKRLSDEENRLTLEELYQFSQAIKSAVKAYYDVLEPGNSEWSDQERVMLSQINRLTAYDLLLMAFSVMTSIEDIALRISCLAALERHGFLSRIRPYFFSEIKVEALTVSLIAKEKEPTEVVRELEAVSDRFVASSDFHDALRGIGKAGGYYTWGALRHFLYEYEQDLRRQSKTARELLDWEDYIKEDYDTDHKTIEHIYPQRAVDPYWRQKFDKYTVSERNILRNSLGNLLPISHRKNSSLSNKGFDAKKGSADNKIGYRYGCLSEIQVSLEDCWDAKQILRRGLELLSFMEKRWRFSLGTPLEKMELLGLGFVLNREGVTIESIQSRNSLIPAASDEGVAPLPVAVKKVRVVKRK